MILRDDLLIDVLKEISDHILHHKIVIKWDFDEDNLLSKHGKKLLHTVPSFDALRQFLKEVGKPNYKACKEGIVFVKTVM